MSTVPISCLDYIESRLKALDRQDELMYRDNEKALALSKKEIDGNLQHYEKAHDALLTRITVLESWKDNLTGRASRSQLYSVGSLVIATISIIVSFVLHSK
jgi:hypothetical protein